MSTVAKRSLRHIAIATILAAIAFAAGTNDTIRNTAQGLGAEAVLNWIGILITVFSLSVTFFLAVMAVEAFTHLGKLREVSEKYDELLSRMTIDEKRVDEIGDALFEYNIQLVKHLEAVVQGSDLNNEQKTKLGERYAVSRSRLDLAGLRSADELTIETAMPNILVLVEFGRTSDLELALTYLGRLDSPHETYAITGQIIKRLKSISSSAS